MAVDPGRDQSVAGAVAAGWRTGIVRVVEANPRTQSRERPTALPRGAIARSIHPPAWTLERVHPLFEWKFANRFWDKQILENPVL